jgi:hypothetical protein
VARSNNKKTDGSTTNLKAYAVIKDAYNNSEVVSETTNRTIYMPYRTLAIPSGIGNVKVTGDNVSVNGNNITYTAASVKFETASNLTSYMPRNMQSFCVAVCGTPKEAIDGFAGTTILARTLPDKYINLTAGNPETNVSVSLNVDSGIDLSDFKDLFVCIWYAGYTEDYDTTGYSIAGVLEELELSKNVFEANKSVAGVTLDISAGNDNKKYYLERAFCDKVEGGSYVRGTYQKAFEITN